ncbi:MAG: dTDP-4-dehydrorhamnose reductase [Dissulfurispiraceae bacterium]
MNVLITGANGQLAVEFRRYFERTGTHRLTALSKKELDISNFESVSEALSVNDPSVVINCAAYNLVDRAEDDRDAAFRVNAAGVKNLAALCRKNKALLIHYSTDYVFDGSKENYYTEADSTYPLNVYGESKLSGERLLAEENDDFLLFRVSWVFGQGISNFLYKLSEWAKDRDVLKIVCNQVSVPTYTNDIVKYTMTAYDKGLRGIYHLTNGGYASRYELARYFIERLGLKRTVLPTDSHFFNERARRPYFSAMSNRKLSRDLGMEIPEWTDAVDRFIERQNKT